MPDVEIVKFETAVEKLCADWTLDVVNMLTKAKTAVVERTRTLRKQVGAIPFPTGAQPANIDKIPDRLNEILAEESVRLKGLVEVELSAKVKDKKQLIVDGHKMAGIITSL